MNQYPLRDVKWLADNLGIDLKTDQKQYMWFIKQALQSILPTDWKKEESKGKTYYHNQDMLITTEKHPMVYKFRAAFNRLIKQNVVKQAENREKLVRGNSKRSLLSEGEKNIAVLTQKEQKTMFKQLLDRAKMKQGDPMVNSLKESFDFYKLITEEKIKGPPAAIAKTLAYKTVHPEQMAKKAKELGIGGRYEYYWIARLALALPLPPCWFRKTERSKSVWVNTEFNVKLPVHPASEFIRDLIHQFRAMQDDTDYTPSQEMFFVDNQNLEYKVDLVALVSWKPNYSTYLNLKDDSETPDIKPRQSIWMPNDEGSYEKIINNIMIFDIAHSIGIDINSEIHLLGSVNRLIENLQSRGKMHYWQFRLTLEGKKYWYNSKKEKSLQIFPYSEQIKEQVNKIRKIMSRQSDKYYREVASRHPLFTEIQSIYEMAKSEATVYTENCISRYVGEPYIKYVDLAFLKQSVHAKMDQDVDMNHLMNLLFANPYSLDIGLDKFNIEKLENPDLKLQTDNEDEDYSDVDLDESQLKELKKDGEIVLTPKEKRSDDIVINSESVSVISNESDILSEDELKVMTKNENLRRAGFLAIRQAIKGIEFGQSLNDTKANEKTERKFRRKFTYKQKPTPNQNRKTVPADYSAVKSQLPKRQRHVGRRKTTINRNSDPAKSSVIGTSENSPEPTKKRVRQNRRKNTQSSQSPGAGMAYTPRLSSGSSISSMPEVRMAPRETIEVRNAPREIKEAEERNPFSTNNRTPSNNSIKLSGSINKIYEEGSNSNLSISGVSIKSDQRFTEAEMLKRKQHKTVDFAKTKPSHSFNAEEASNKRQLKTLPLKNTKISVSFNSKSELKKSASLSRSSSKVELSNPLVPETKVKKLTFESPPKLADSKNDDISNSSPGQSNDQNGWKIVVDAPQPSQEELLAEKQAQKADWFQKGQLQPDDSFMTDDSLTESEEEGPFEPILMKAKQEAAKNRRSFAVVHKQHYRRSFVVVNKEHINNLHPEEVVKDREEVVREARQAEENIIRSDLYKVHEAIRKTLDDQVENGWERLKRDSISKSPFRVELFKAGLSKTGRENIANYQDMSNKFRRQSCLLQLEVEELRPTKTMSDIKQIDEQTANEFAAIHGSDDADKRRNSFNGPIQLQILNKEIKIDLDKSIELKSAASPTSEDGLLGLDSNIHEEEIEKLDREFLKSDRRLSAPSTIFSSINSKSASSDAHQSIDNQAQRTPYKKSSTTPIPPITTPISVPPTTTPDDSPAPITNEPKGNDPAPTKEAQAPLETIQESSTTQCEIANQPVQILFTRKKAVVPQLPLDTIKDHPDSPTEMKAVNHYKSASIPSSVFKPMRSQTPKEVIVGMKKRLNVRKVVNHSRQMSNMTEKVIQTDRPGPVFDFYHENLGLPEELERMNIVSKATISPQDVVNAGIRLGVMVSETAFESRESDLLWIPQLQLSIPHPKGARDQDLLLTPLRKHPSDEYFLSLLSLHRRKRASAIQKMPNSKTRDLIFSNSWICFRKGRDRKYFYNGLTCECSNNPAGI